MSVASNSGKQLKSLIDNFWQWKLKDSPVLALTAGTGLYTDRLHSRSFEAEDARIAQVTEFDECLKGIDKAALSEQQKFHSKLLAAQFRTFLDGSKWKDHSPLNAYNFLDNVLSHFAYFIIPYTNFNSTKDFDAYFSRLECMPRLIDEQIAHCEKAVKNRVTLHSVSIEHFATKLEALIQSSELPFLEPLSKAAGLQPDEKDGLLARGTKIMNDSVIPALQRQLDYTRTKYSKHLRSECGIGSLPRGLEFYQAVLDWNVTQSISPEDIHAIGLREVARIEGRMRNVVAEVGFSGTLTEFVEGLRKDAKFCRFNCEADLLDEYRKIIFERISPALPRLFNHVPPQPLVVSKMLMPGPEAMYFQGSADGERPGTFYVNTANPETRTSFPMVALALHEALPGHHFQKCWVLERDLPDFARYDDYLDLCAAPCLFPTYNAYTEGWGLYAEALGEELGLYRDPYELFGRLTLEIMRAIRLVVDTGMHAKGWTRDEAIAYMSQKASLPQDEIVMEIDRYITWPGQACAYKLGEMKIWELRHRAEQQLGDKFDVRDFHDVILNTGSVTLALLEERVEAWLYDKR